MPRLKNRKREHFAIEVAPMTPPDRAYLLAGFKDSKWAPYNARKLANTPAVAARIAELQREFAERAQLHAEYVQRSPRGAAWLATGLTLAIRIGKWAFMPAASSMGRNRPICQSSRPRKSS
jgi:hypothetical protein